MASGMADYYRGIRPSFGGAVLAADQVYVWDGVLTSLVQINGRGMVYGGTVWLDYTSTQANSEVWLGIDGQHIEGLSFVKLNAYNVVKPGSSVISLNKFDGTNFIYSVGIAYGITFETRLDLRYYEKHNTRPTVHYRLVYTLI